MAPEVWRADAVGDEAAEDARGRKRAPEEARRRPVARQGHVTGCREKKVVKPARARRLVEYLRASYRISIRRACGVVRFDRSTYHYRHRRPGQAVPHETHPRAGRGPRPVWLPAHSRPAPSGGVDDQPQAHSTPVSAGGSAATPQTTQTEGFGEGAGRSCRG